MIVLPPGVNLRSLSAIMLRSETVAFFSRLANCNFFFWRCLRRLISFPRSLIPTGKLLDPIAFAAVIVNENAGCQSFYHARSGPSTHES